ERMQDRDGALELRLAPGPASDREMHGAVLARSTLRRLRRRFGGGPQQLRRANGDHSDEDEWVLHELPSTDKCWPSTAAIFRQPSILRNLICPLATGRMRHFSFST